MTKKDYELIACRIKAERISWKESSGPVYGTEAVRALADFAEALATDLKHDNPRFDRDRFLATCGVTRNEV